jgi:hypothetical protein
MARPGVFTPETLREMIERYKTGGLESTLSALARRYGVNHTSILYHLDRLGVPKRPKPPQAQRPKLWDKERRCFACCGSRSPRRHLDTCPVKPPEKKPVFVFDPKPKTYLEYVADACRRGDRTIQAIVSGGRHVHRGAQIRPVDLSNSPD